MVFGNMGNTSGTCVLFTRNPSTGEKKLYGEFLINSQGEDVVAGIRTHEDLDIMKNCMPQAYKELVENCEILEHHYKDMMDIEFTVQENRLWMLQCRSGKRTGKGVIKIAVNMVTEGLVDTRNAVKLVEPQHLDQLLHPQGDQVEEFQPICEVQSDKATIEITSRYNGKVSQILHVPGDIVKVGETLPRMMVEGASFPARTDNTSKIEEYGIDLNDVCGTGKDGRVLREDVQHYAANKGII